MSRRLLAGLNTAVQQALHMDGVAAVLAPEFAPKRDRHADRQRHLVKGGRLVLRLANTGSLGLALSGPAFVSARVSVG
jgi:hypothetical protein